MMHGFITEALSWVSMHPNLALITVFAVAVLESLFLLGLLIPGAIFMFAFGAMIGASALSGTATFIVAIIGTLLGDSASYALGRRYHKRLHELPGLSRIPGGVSRGEEFFSRHGGKSIVFGRLIGALRPVMPTVAGAAGLPIARFAVMEVIAALLWAPIYIGPGIVFGASLDLAAQVATRLAILLIAAAGIIWVLTSLTRFIVVTGNSIGRRYAERLMDWSRHHRRLGLLGPALADPRQPEIPALLVAAGLLIVVITLLHGLLWLSYGLTPGGLDTLVFYMVDSLHNAPTTAVARIIAVAGSPLIYLPFSIAIAIALTVMGNRRAVGYWIVAIIFSSIATLLIRWLPLTAPPAIFFDTSYAEPLYLTGSQDLVLCATVYGLVGIIIGARQPESLRPYYFSGTVAGIVLIALARLYLGLEWATTSLIALVTSFIWINLLIIAYRRQHPRPVRASPLFTILACFVGIAALFVVLGEYPIARTQTEQARSQITIDWRGGAYRDLPQYIGTLRQRVGTPLNVQAAGTNNALNRTLALAGWQKPPALDIGSVLRSLAPDATIDMLPVMPRIHDGQAAALVWIHPIDDTHRWVLRLWPTPYVTSHPRQSVWVGSVVKQQIGHALHIVTVARDRDRYLEAMHYLDHSLKAQNIGHLQPNENGRHLLLLWPNPRESMVK